jgi:uncharacterized protein DUF6504
MSGIRSEPVKVWLRDSTPARFVWRGRRYTVMFVLGRRLIADAAATDPAAATDAGRECWLVEATPERTLPPATYELCHDLAADRWSLSRG